MSSSWPLFVMVSAPTDVSPERPSTFVRLGNLISSDPLTVVSSESPSRLVMSVPTSWKPDGATRQSKLSISVCKKTKPESGVLQSCACAVGRATRAAAQSESD